MVGIDREDMQAFQIIPTIDLHFCLLPNSWAVVLAAVRRVIFANTSGEHGAAATASDGVDGC